MPAAPRGRSTRASAARTFARVITVGDGCRSASSSGRTDLVSPRDAHAYPLGPAPLRGKRLVAYAHPSTHAGASRGLGPITGVRSLGESHIGCSHTFLTHGGYTNAAIDRRGIHTRVGSRASSSAVNDRVEAELPSDDSWLPHCRHSGTIHLTAPLRQERKPRWCDCLRRGAAAPDHRRPTDRSCIHDGTGNLGADHGSVAMRGLRDAAVDRWGRAN